MLSCAHLPTLVYDSGVFVGRFMTHVAVTAFAPTQTILTYGAQVVSDVGRSISCLR